MAEEGRHKKIGNQQKSAHLNLPPIEKSASPRTKQKSKYIHTMNKHSSHRQLPQTGPALAPSTPEEVVVGLGLHLQLLGRQVARDTGVGG